MDPKMNPKTDPKKDPKRDPKMTPNPDPQTKVLYWFCNKNGKSEAKDGKR